MRINKFLAQAGLGSRRKVEQLILDNKITINGDIVNDLSINVLDTDEVLYDGKIINKNDEYVYIMLNKPKCYLSTVSDDRGRKTVIDLVKSIDKKIYPVGRLDYNTEGLLILTNDGDFTNKITHPRNHIGKTYEVKLKICPKNKDLVALRNGIIIDGIKTNKAIVNNPILLDDYYYLNITIFEGRNREIRKMFEVIGYKIYNLKRLSIGNLQLGNLQIGKYKILSNNDLNKIFN